MYTINPWLIGALIFCATAIAIVAICCDYRVEQKSIDTKKDNDTNNGNNSNECRLSKKIIKIHRNYIAGFLGFAIIMLLTAQFGRSYNAIYNYLSFASTITSLVLSILAIFVTVHSSADLYKQFTRIDSATETINSVSEKIGNSLNAIEIADNSLQQTAGNITSQLDDIAKTIIKRIEKNEEFVFGILGTTGLNQKPNEEHIERDKGNKKFESVKDEDVKSFLSRSSPFGLFVLYACAISMENNIPCDISKLFKDSQSSNYAFGFLVATNAAGLIQFDGKYGDTLRFTYIFVKKEKLLEIIMSSIKKMESSDDRKFSIATINDINDFFGVKHLELK